MAPCEGAPKVAARLILRLLLHAEPADQALLRLVPLRT